MSIYIATNELDIHRARSRLEYLIEKGKTFEIIEKKPKRSLSQNNYLHLILSFFALEYGETLEYVKQEIFKKQVNREIFKTEYINPKTGEVREAWRSTSSLDTKEMTLAIDRFRNFSSKEAGIYLPAPEDMVYLNEIEREIKKYNNQNYL